MKQSLAQFKKNPLISISAAATIADAKETAASEGIHHLPVMSDDTLVGLICTCDMSTAPEEAFVVDWMREPITLSLQHTREDAVSLMNECAVGSVILLEDETPRGIVTRGDLIDSRPPLTLSEEIAKCSCCGSRSHLRTNFSGRTLCVECRKLPRSALEQS